MKNYFETPIMNISLFNHEDVVTASTPTTNAAQAEGYVGTVDSTNLTQSVYAVLDWQ